MSLSPTLEDLMRETREMMLYKAAERIGTNVMCFQLQAHCQFKEDTLEALEAIVQDAKLILRYLEELG